MKKKIKMQLPKSMVERIDVIEYCFCLLSMEDQFIECFLDIFLDGYQEIEHGSYINLIILKACTARLFGQGITTSDLLPTHSELFH